MTETREGTDVVERLRALARHEHSDLSIGHEAADIIDVHLDPTPTPGTAGEGGK